MPFVVSFSNSGDSSFNNERQSKDGDNGSEDSEPRKLNESHESGDNGGFGGANELNESTTTTTTATTIRTAASEAAAATSPKPANEERPFPRIQIKSPSKLAQEFNEKQKQSDIASMMSASNESNRTNNNKSSVDLNTTPLYDEPTENRSYSLKETPTLHSFDSQNHEPISSMDNNAIVAEITDNREH